MEKIKMSIDSTAPEEAADVIHELFKLYYDNKVELRNFKISLNSKPIDLDWLKRKYDDNNQSK